MALKRRPLTSTPPKTRPTGGPSVPPKKASPPSRSPTNSGSSLGALGAAGALGAVAANAGGLLPGLVNTSGQVAQTALFADVAEAVLETINEIIDVVKENPLVLYGALAVAGLLLIR